MAGLEIETGAIIEGLAVRPGITTTPLAPPLEVGACCGELSCFVAGVGFEPTTFGL